MRSASVCLFLFAITLPLHATTIGISGKGILVQAGNNEVNTVEINGPVSEGVAGAGFQISDSTAPVAAVPPCIAVAGSVGGSVVCPGPLPEFVRVELGDGDDEVSTQFTVRMIVRGGTGNDTILGGPAPDDLDGDLGDDTIHGGNGADKIHGGLGADTLFGDEGVDKIDAGVGKDVINSQDGNVETVRCGGGQDTLTKDPNDKTRLCN
jgi:Ca2+-binding RTX toxin-like protein